MKTKICAAVSAAAVLALFAAACSSNSNENDSEPAVTATAATSAPATPDAASETSSTVTAAPVNADGTVSEVSATVAFTAENGTGTITVSGDRSPVAEWLQNLPGEVVLDLADADVEDPVSVVEELVSFWFFSDDASGDVPPSIFESASGDISDSLGTSYVVDAQPLPAAPGTETTTTTATTSSPTTTTSSPETSETATSTTTTTTIAAAPAATSPVAAELSPSQLQVQVLNGSGVAGAAGRLSASLRDAGYAVLPAGNAPGRFATSAVYYVASEHQDEAELVAEIIAENIENANNVAVASLPDTGQIQPGTANVVVLIGRDDLGGNLRTAERSSGLRRTPDSDTTLPLADDVPRDRYVPGLLDIQIFRADNDQASDEMKGVLNALSGWFNIAGRYTGLGARAAGQLAADLEPGMDYDYLKSEVYPNIERALEWLGFTPQNVCGAPAGYSFTDLMRPTREFDIESQNYTGPAIFTTDRLIELHGGQRINPQENLDSYIRQAAQTAHDHLRVSELLSETESMQIILCVPLTAPEGEIPEFANSLYYGQFIPGVQPQETLLSQGAYHVKEISRNGNFAYLIVCHPTIGERYVWMWWRETGYRAEITGSTQNNGCQATYEADTYLYEDTDGAEDTFRFAFGERVFSASDLQAFPQGGIG